MGRRDGSWLFLPASASLRQSVVLPVAVETGRASAIRSPGAAGAVVQPGRRARHSVTGMRRMMPPADSGGPAGAVVVRPGIPRRYVAPPVNASDGINGRASGGIGVNGASARSVAPDGESGGIIQESGLSTRWEADFSVDMDSGLRHGGGKGQEGKQGAPGAVGKNVVFNGVVFHGLLERCSGEVTR